MAYSNQPPCKPSSSTSSAGSEQLSTRPYNPYTAAFFAAVNRNSLSSRRDVGLELLCRTTYPCIWSKNDGCLPETRKDNIHDLHQWASSVTTPGRIACVYGPLGVGKSTVLRSVQSRLYDSGNLGGTFSFQRDNVKNESVIRTLAHQLARNVPNLRPIISRVVRKSPCVLEQSLAVQLKKLIVEPCRQAATPLPLVLVLDGVDECEGELLREVLLLLESAIQESASPLRIILVSRICLDIFRTASVSSFNVARSFEDVRTYLKIECTKIRHGASTWLTPKALDIAVRVSCGCFQTARTLVNFLGDPEFCPTERIEQLSRLAAAPPQAFPHNPLDSLFFMILSSMDPLFRPSMLAFLRIIVTPQFSRFSIRHIEQLLGLEHGHLYAHVLPSIRSLFLPYSADDFGCAGVEVFHPSFLDFLVDPARSEMFCVATPTFDMALVGSVLRALSYQNSDPSAYIKSQGHVAWSHLDAIVDYITSVSVDTMSNREIVGLVDHINPDFFFHSLSIFDHLGQSIIHWLKAMDPLPANTISRWEDYEYVSFFYSVINDLDLDDLETSTHCDQLAELLRDAASPVNHPNIKRLIRASVAIPALTPLTQFRLLLGAEHELLCDTICLVLKPLFGRDKQAIEQLWAVNARAMRRQRAATTKESCGAGDVYRDLACNSLQIIRQVYDRRIPFEMMGFWLEWGRYVRESPTGGEACDAVLGALGSFVPHECMSEWGISVESEIHDVLKWLENVPSVSQSELLRWEGYLPGGTEQQRYVAYESRWQGTRG